MKPRLVLLAAVCAVLAVVILTRALDRDRPQPGSDPAQSLIEPTASALVLEPLPPSSNEAREKVVASDESFADAVRRTGGCVMPTFSNEVTFEVPLPDPSDEVATARYLAAKAYLQEFERRQSGK